MVIDFENRVWIAGDVRVRSFDIETLAPDDTLYIPQMVRPIRQSCLAVWGEFIVLGTGDSLFGWKREGHSQAKELNRTKFADFARGQVDPATIDWTRGRSPDRGFEMKPEIHNITAICAVGDYLAVASESYEAVHIYSLSNERALVTRLVGHTMGVTALFPGGDKELLTGSADMTAKLWNLQTGTATYTFERHGGAVSALSLEKYQGSLFLFTGGVDSSVWAWYVTEKKGMCQIEVGEKLYPSQLCFRAGQKQLSILARRLPEQNELEETEAVDSIAQLQVYAFKKASSS
jgi:hypothetical protein